MKYNNEAAALTWEIVNDQKDIGNWVLSYRGVDYKGKSFNGFLEKAASLFTERTVIYVKYLRWFVHISLNFVNYEGKEFFANGEKEFYYIEINDLVVLRNWDQFEKKVYDGQEFLRRLNIMRDNFKGENKNRLGLEKHFNFTKARDMWEDMRYRYFLRAPWAKNTCEMMIPQTLEEYDLLNQLNKSGYYYQNPLYTNKTCPDVRQYDISSSHISLMARKKFPASYGTYEEDGKKIQKIIKDDFYSWYGLFRFSGLRYQVELPMYFGNWICRDTECTGEENCFYVYINEVDMRWFKKVFKWDKAIVIDFWWAERKEICKDYAKMLDELYRIKNAQKKGTYAKEISKFRAELPFGQAIKRVEYDSKTVYDSKTNSFMVEEEEEIEFEKIQNKLRKRGIPFQYGAWTVSYSRLQLIEMILKIGVNKVIYADTDCVKFIGDEGIKIIEEHNREIDKEFEQIEKKRLLKFHPKMGRWLDEGRLVGFKAIAVKWYLTLDFEDNFDVKCAGGDPEILLEWIKKQSSPFDAFKKSMKTPRLFKNIAISKEDPRALVFNYKNGITKEEREKMQKHQRIIDLYSYEELKRLYLQEAS